MANERIISADSHVAIREDAVLEHLSTKYHEGYKQSPLEYIQRMMARAKRNASAELPIGAGDKPRAAAGRPGAYHPTERPQDHATHGGAAGLLYPQG